MAQPQAQRNGFTHGREQGIYVDEHSARFREIIGRDIPITFEIVDKSRGRARSAKKEGEPARKYTVTISEGSNSVDHLYRHEYTEPGTYTVNIELDSPQLVTLVVHMVNEHGQAFASTFAVSYNRHFYKTLKWMAALPLLIASTLLFFSPSALSGRGGGTPLPS